MVLVENNLKVNHRSWLEYMLVGWRQDDSPMTIGRCQGQGEGNRWLTICCILFSNTIFVYRTPSSFRCQIVRLSATTIGWRVHSSHNMVREGCRNSFVLFSLPYHPRIVVTSSTYYYGCDLPIQIFTCWEYHTWVISSIFLPGLMPSRRVSTTFDKEPPYGCLLVRFCWPRTGTCGFN